MQYLVLFPAHDTRTQEKVKQWISAAKGLAIEDLRLKLQKQFSGTTFQTLTQEELKRMLDDEDKLTKKRSWSWRDAAYGFDPEKQEVFLLERGWDEQL